jgi:hypothetical protein
MAYQATMDCHRQNDNQLYMALTNSADEDTKGKMQREKAEFMTGAANNIPSGMLYFKKLMIKAEVDSRAMVSHIRDTLGSLDTYMYTTTNSNITNFSDYVRNQMAALLNNLFKAYARVDCEEFRDFIKDTRHDWERNHRVYDPEILMNECHDDYSRLLLLSRWGHIMSKKSK